MSTGFKMKCIQDIIKCISLPPTNSVVINKDNIRICYRVAAHDTYSYINLATQEEVAKFLRQKGKIEMYSMVHDQVKLFVKRVVTEVVKDKPVLHVQLVELPWCELSFTEGELLHYAAENEYKLTCTMLGLARAKVIKFTTEIFRAA